MNVLIVGGGGREHAIVWSLSQSPRVDTIYCAPGNAGISKLARCLPVDVEDFDGIADAVREHGIGLAVIGPEVPLANGITDALEASGTKVFGPNKKCARLEASKAFTKEFLERHGIPTAKHKVFADKEDLLEAIGIFGFPMVLKADGLAAGKGVVIAKTAEEAKIAIEQMMCERIFGEAGDKVVVEEFLSGVEASVLCFVDEKTIVPMESAQDYKRVYDNDEGPNTGGMGAYSPSLLFDGALEKRVMDEILAPTLKGLKADGLDYKGVLYAGLMITDEGPKVIEFNVRFGDPETQAVLPRLKTDLLDIFLAVTENTLADVDIKWSSQKTVCVVMASGGYPGSYEKGFVIEGLDNVDNDVWVFHAGTALSQSCGGSSCGAAAVTAGGRVLGVAAADDSHEAAREKAYKNVAKIFFEGAQCRKDIGIVR